MKKIIKGIVLLWNFPKDVWLMFITYLPGKSGSVLRRKYWKKRLKFLGKDVVIDIGTFFQNPQFISLDDNVWIDRFVQILAGVPNQERITHFKENPNFHLSLGDVHIGKQVHIAPNCILSGIGGLSIGDYSGVSANTSIYSFSHHYKNLNDKGDLNQYYFTPQASSEKQAMISGPVVIGNFCGIGAHSVILPGTSILEGSLVASGSVVSGDYPEHSIIANDQENRIKPINNLVILR
jgi:acetyltransferase-like isoleucine patch superfamily enzyme